MGAREEQVSVKGASLLAFTTVPGVPTLNFHVRAAVDSPIHSLSLGLAALTLQAPARRRGRRGRRARLHVEIPLSLSLCARPLHGDSAAAATARGDVAAAAAMLVPDCPRILSTERAGKEGARARAAAAARALSRSDRSSARPRLFVSGPFALEEAASPDSRPSQGQHSGEGGEPRFCLFWNLDRGALPLFFRPRRPRARRTPPRPFPPATPEEIQASASGSAVSSLVPGAAVHLGGQRL